MSHVIEPAPSGRAGCRGCGGKIEKGALRLGERLPNPFSEDKLMTLWFHPRCGAYKRPAVFLEAVASTEADLPGREELVAEAERGVAHRRLPRVDGAERAPSARARCRSCKEAIPKEAWRIKLVYYDEGRFEPSGYLHPGCAKEYFETAEILDRVRHFAPDLGEDAMQQIRRELGA